MNTRNGFVLLNGIGDGDNRSREANNARSDVGTPTRIADPEKVTFMTDLLTKSWIELSEISSFI